MKPTKPDCPNHEAWQGYLEARKYKKFPNTSHALVLLVNRLLRFHGEGQDIAMMLERATTAGWNTVYAVKGYVRHEEKTVQPRSKIVCPEIVAIKENILTEAKVFRVNSTPVQRADARKNIKKLQKELDDFVPKVGEILKK